MKTWKRTVTLVVGGLVLLSAGGVRAQSPDSDPNSIKQQIRQLKEETDRKIEALERELKAVQSENRTQIEKLNTEAHQTEQKLEVQQKASTQQIKSVVKTELAEEAPSTFGGLLSSYWGQHRFLVLGGGATTFAYDRNTNQNTFAAALLPVILWRLSDRIFFQGHLEVTLPASGGTDVGLEYAEFNAFLNKYLEVGVGKFLLPFGDFISDVHPPWLDRFITHPVPYREDVGMLPFDALGMQARGAVQ